MENAKNHTAELPPLRYQTLIKVAGPMGESLVWLSVRNQKKGTIRHEQWFSCKIYYQIAK